LALHDFEQNLAQLIGTVLSAVIELATGLIEYLGGAIETVALGRFGSGPGH
tara:strand:- start:3913 stop:4065 length:153 start_codon:yes stop_codon:yes gene_type:complete